jgi:hypothetical protein
MQGPSAGKWRPTDGASFHREVDSRARRGKERLEQHLPGQVQGVANTTSAPGAKFQFLHRSAERPAVTLDSLEPRAGYAN